MIFLLGNFTKNLICILRILLTTPYKAVYEVAKDLVTHIIYQTGKWKLIYYVIKLGLFQTNEDELFIWMNRLTEPLISFFVQSLSTAVMYMHFATTAIVEASKEEEKFLSHIGISHKKKGLLFSPMVVGNSNVI